MNGSVLSMRAAMPVDKSVTFLVSVSVAEID